MVPVLLYLSFSWRILPMTILVKTEIQSVIRLVLLRLRPRCTFSSAMAWITFFTLYFCCSLRHDPSEFTTYFHAQNHESKITKVEGDQRRAEKSAKGIPLVLLPLEVQKRTISSNRLANVMQNHLFPIRSLTSPTVALRLKASKKSRAKALISSCNLGSTFLPSFPVFHNSPANKKAI